MSDPTRALLSDDDGSAFEIVNSRGKSSAVLVCDHASPRIPARLGGLGLSEADRLSHIGWDIGAADVSRRLSALLDAPLLLSGFSRLVIDCNRPLGAESSIPLVTGGVTVPGNHNLAEASVRARADECFRPYHRAIAELLDARVSEGRPMRLLAVHSFTPVMLGEVRPWHAAVLYGRDRSLAAPWIAELRREEGLVIGDNEPYRVTDGGDSTIPVHGERRGIPSVIIELRQDLVATAEGARRWAERLAQIHRSVDALLESSTR